MSKLTKLLRGLRRKGSVLLRTHVQRRVASPDFGTFRLPRGTGVQIGEALADGWYETKERAAIRKWMGPDCGVIELGGCLGIVSVTIEAQIEGRKHVIVEANPALIDICRRNILDNVPAAQIELLNTCISYDASATVGFAVDGGLLESMVGPVPGRHVVQVPATTLGELAERYFKDEEFVLVSDVEGMEFDIFAKDAAALKRCRLAIVEIHPPVFEKCGFTEEMFHVFADAAGFDMVDREGNVIVLQNRAVDRHVHLAA